MPKGNTAQPSEERGERREECFAEKKQIERSQISPFFRDQSLERRSLLMRSLCILAFPDGACSRWFHGRISAAGSAAAAPESTSSWLSLLCVQTCEQCPCLSPDDGSYLEYDACLVDPADDCEARLPLLAKVGGALCSLRPADGSRSIAFEGSVLHTDAAASARLRVLFPELCSAGRILVAAIVVEGVLEWEPPRRGVAAGGDVRSTAGSASAASATGIGTAATAAAFSGTAYDAGGRPSALRRRWLVGDRSDRDSSVDGPQSCTLAGSDGAFDVQRLSPLPLIMRAGAEYAHSLLRRRWRAPPQPASDAHAHPDPAAVSACGCDSAAGTSDCPAGTDAPATSSTATTVRPLRNDPTVDADGWIVGRAQQRKR